MVDLILMAMKGYSILFGSKTGASLSDAVKHYTSNTSFCGGLTLSQCILSFANDAENPSKKSIYFYENWFINL